MNEQLLLIATLVCASLVGLCTFLNIVRAVQGYEPSQGITRLLYITGLATLICNALRVSILYSETRGIMLTAHIVVLICLMISFVRSERKESDLTEQP